MKSCSTALAVVTLLAGCAPDDQRTADRADTSRLAPATADRDAAPELLVPSGTIPTRSGQLRVERLAALEEPWGMAFLPDGRLLITEKPGRLRIFDQGKLSAAVEGVPAVVYFGQGGLLDVAVDPDFARNQFVYLSYAEAATPQPPGAQQTKEPRLGAFQRMEDRVLKGGAVARGRLDGGALRDVRVIWQQVPKTVGRGHFSGRLAFAPDSTLFILSLIHI